MSAPATELSFYTSSWELKTTDGIVSVQVIGKSVNVPQTQDYLDWLSDQSKKEAALSFLHGYEGQGKKSRHWVMLATKNPTESHSFFFTRLWRRKVTAGITSLNVTGVNGETYDISVPQTKDCNEWLALQTCKGQWKPPLKFLYGGTGQAYWIKLAPENPAELKYNFRSRLWELEKTPENGSIIASLRLDKARVSIPQTKKGLVWLESEIKKGPEKAELRFADVFSNVLSTTDNKQSVKLSYVPRVLRDNTQS